MFYMNFFFFSALEMPFAGKEKSFKHLTKNFDLFQ